jgi:hypothetical protein
MELLIQLETLELLRFMYCIDWHHLIRPIIGSALILYKYP